MASLGVAGSTNTLLLPAFIVSGGLFVVLCGFALKRLYWRDSDGLTARDRERRRSDWRIRRRLEREKERGNLGEKPKLWDVWVRLKGGGVGDGDGAEVMSGRDGDEEASQNGKDATIEMIDIQPPIQPFSASVISERTEVPPSSPQQASPKSKSKSKAIPPLAEPPRPSHTQLQTSYIIIMPQIVDVRHTNDADEPIMDYAIGTEDVWTSWTRVSTTT